MHKTSIPLTACALAAFVLASPSAAAHAVFKVCDARGACGIAQAIGDAQLAGVAGKFTIAGQVVGMDLKMTSSWQAANGQRLEASAGVSIALPNSGRASARFDTHASASDPAPGAPGNQTAGLVQQGRGLQGVSGVAQVIQVAGDGNGAANHAAVGLSHAPLPAGSGNGRLSASETAANGARASVAIAGNAVSLQLTLPDAGRASQQVNLADAGNIHQNIQIAAHGQQVMNQLQLQLQMQPATRAALMSQGVTGALHMLRGR